MRKVLRDEVWDAVHRGGQARAPTDALPRFKAGDRIVVRRINPVGHTRLPRFVRGCEGTVQEQRGSFVFPDTRAHGLGDKPQHIYSVKFTARELWGDQADGKDAIYLDLWDDYIVGTGADR
jgi:hypothetical protein